MKTDVTRWTTSPPDAPGPWLIYTKRGDVVPCRVERRAEFAGALCVSTPGQTGWRLPAQVAARAWSRVVVPPIEQIEEEEDADDHAA